ncbi:MAG: L-asparaginase [Burkholderiales bacterium PBB4]|nr:MAG: L-asparaginase [Burkholderiales bacterium PBB4]
MMKKVVFLGTGGTIAGSAGDPADSVGYQAAQFSIDALLKELPALKVALGDFDLEAEQVAQVDSKDMDWPHWVALRARAFHHLQRDEVGGLVITHGTDTLEETSYFLSRIIPVEWLASKPVVLTCAMRPATADFPDGPKNLCDAATVATTSAARGVLTVCAGVVHAAREVQKVHPYRIDAFSSGEGGPLGWVEEGRVRWVRQCSPIEWEGGADLAQTNFNGSWPRVEIVINSTGIGGAMVRALCRGIAGADAKLAGIVVAGTGNGTVNHDMAAALLEAQEQGIRVILTTRCAMGQIVTRRYANPLQNTRYLGLSPVKARIELILELLAGKGE